MGPTLKVHPRQEYGNKRLYLAKDPIGQAVQILTGKATLSPDHAKALQALGVQIMEA